MSVLKNLIEQARTWPRFLLAAGSITLALWRPAFAADGPSLLKDGLYEVAVSLELPHVEDSAIKSTAKICVTRTDASGTRGLAVLSQNNPLGHCPASHVRRDQETLKFTITCEGKNAAQAQAVYVLSPENFQGRIEMKMGGKNMTMTETQRGRRIGLCEPASRS